MLRLLRTARSPSSPSGQSAHRSNWAAIQEPAVRRRLSLQHSRRLVVRALLHGLVDLAQQQGEADVDGGGDQVFLAGEVAVDARGGNADLAGDLAQGERRPRELVVVTSEGRIARMVAYQAG